MNYLEKIQALVECARAANHAAIDCRRNFLVRLAYNAKLTRIEAMRQARNMKEESAIVQLGH